MFKVDARRVPHVSVWVIPYSGRHEFEQVQFVFGMIRENEERHVGFKQSIRIDPTP